jgi:hypothetical protein
MMAASLRKRGGRCVGKVRSLEEFNSSATGRGRMKEARSMLLRLFSKQDSRQSRARLADPVSSADETRDGSGIAAE